MGKKLENKCSDCNDMSCDDPNYPHPPSPSNPQYTGGHEGVGGGAACQVNHCSEVARSIRVWSSEVPAWESNRVWDIPPLNYGAGLRGW